MMRPRPKFASQLYALALAAGLALTIPAQAQFYWPWQTRPAAPPPPPPVAPPAPAQQRAAPKPAPKPQASKPSDGKQGDAKAGDKKDDKAEVPDAPPPPYEPQLLRLSEILGALAFLRPLCGGNDAQDWRNKMTQLMEAEATTEPRKERLAGAYNRGYREYAQVYRRCTPAAEVVIQRYAEEGGKLTRELTSRFGG
jgi:uncharacterized protein (TIGR02301 family)